MPELPEVETIVSDLHKQGVVGERVIAVNINWPRSIAIPSHQQFIKTAKNKTIKDIRRRAKYLVFELNENYFLLLHLRMSGRLNLCKRNDLRSVHEHVILSFASGNDLRFHDTRKFGRCYLTKNPDDILGHLGPEPLSNDFKFDAFFKGLQKSKRSIKTLLLDQQFLAGLGNIYVDESLWDAKIHPESPGCFLKQSEARSLYSSIKKILKIGIKNLGTSLGKTDTNFYSVGKRRGRNQDQLKVFRREGEACPRCLQTIMRKVVGQRGTHFCHQCQILKKA
jgi:formamidopyrimidine-DNA glycosylase